MPNRFEFAGRYNPKIKDYKFWQDALNPIELYSEKFFKQKLDYVHKNPVEVGLVWEAWHSKYSSAIDYWDKVKCLINVEYMDLIG